MPFYPVKFAEWVSKLVEEPEEDVRAIVAVAGGVPKSPSTGAIVGGLASFCDRFGSSVKAGPGEASGLGAYGGIVAVESRSDAGSEVRTPMSTPMASVSIGKAESAIVATAGGGTAGGGTGGGDERSVEIVRASGVLGKGGEGDRRSGRCPMPAFVDVTIPVRIVFDTDARPLPNSLREVVSKIFEKFDGDTVKN